MKTDIAKLVEHELWGWPNANHIAAENGIWLNGYGVKFWRDEESGVKWLLRTTADGTSKIDIGNSVWEIDPTDDATEGVLLNRVALAGFQRIDRSELGWRIWYEVPQDDDETEHLPTRWHPLLGEACVEVLTIRWELVP